MKFKYIFIIFNILIILILLVIAFMPVIVLGPDFAGRVWSSTWPLALILLVVMAGLNVFFLLNRRLFKLLEREDWPALVDYLEHRVIDTGRYSGRLVKLLANSYLIMSDSTGVLRLEKKLSHEKPVLIEKNALIFGAARILGGDAAGAADFFLERLEKGVSANAQWIRWYYGFSLLLSGAFGKAETEFKALAASGNDAIVTGLSAWFLSDALLKNSASPDACEAIARQGRERIEKTLKKIERWKSEAAKGETEIHAAMIKKYIDEAAVWLFAGSDHEQS
jgi:hypothetical protein